MDLINIKKVILHRLNMTLNNPFVTSFGTVQLKDFFIVEVVDEANNRGFGESVAFTAPWYTAETVTTTEHIMRDFLIPRLMEKPIQHPEEVTIRFNVIKQHNMAKAALEIAVWDLYAKRKEQPLYKILQSFANSNKVKIFHDVIDVGVSFGMEEDMNDLFEKIEQYVNQGYKRVKLKIMPGHDITFIQKVRERFPTLSMFVDANGAYTVQDIDILKQLDDFHLMMIEQPFAEDAFLEHADLQRQMKTPICLDESIHSLADVKIAHELGSCEIVNIKLSRVGGLTEAMNIHTYCLAHNIPVWAGGMLEAGVGRAHNIALATLENFTIPGDIAGSSHYFTQDIIEPEVVVHHGSITLPEKPGIGYDLNEEALKRYTISKEVFQS